MYTLNFWPILVASIAAFAIGALWYSPLIFGKEWATLSNISDDDMEKSRSGGIWKAYLSQFVATLVMFAVLGFLISSSGSMSASEGAFFGFIIWLGFMATEAVSGLLWERKPFKLVLIQSVGTLLTLIIGGAIIGAWR